LSLIASVAPSAWRCAARSINATAPSKLIGDSVDTLRSNLYGHPGALDEREWRRILKTISIGFHAERRLIDQHDTLTPAEREQLSAQFKRGAELLVTWFPDLWD
jgi:hypothetical protein